MKQSNFHGVPMSQVSVRKAKRYYKEYMRKIWREQYETITVRKKDKQLFKELCKGKQVMDCFTEMIYNYHMVENYKKIIAMLKSDPVVSGKLKAISKMLGIQLG